MTRLPSFMIYTLERKEWREHVQRKYSPYKPLEEGSLAYNTYEYTYTHTHKTINHFIPIRYIHLLLIYKFDFTNSVIVLILWNYRRCFRQTCTLCNVSYYWDGLMTGLIKTILNIYSKILSKEWWQMLNIWVMELFKEEYVYY